MIHFRSCRAVALILIILGVPNLATAQDKTAKQRESDIDAGWKAFEQGRYSEAEQRFRSAIAAGEKARVQDELMADSLDRLATVLSTIGKYSDAETSYKRSLQIREKVHGANHGHVAQTLNNLASMYQIQGKFSEA